MANAKALFFKQKQVVLMTLSATRSLILNAMSIAVLMDCVYVVVLSKQTKKNGVIYSNMK